ncbi:MAG: bifunctional folylpolyglutamate synthase/dihydrofolate synthase [Actinobacteria bacterium]|nr:bifunctional folylpolyglutamate synthase/dihydrofolate synthase [Actinomycetota bacterium]
MDYLAAVDYLDAHVGQGMKPGLDRIEALLDMMANPESGYPIVHVAGTNGKTSTSRVLSMILSAHDLTTGYFTSPHLERVEERIGVGGRHATPDEFAQAVTDVAAFADLFESRGTDKLTYFELTAAIAFAWFAEIAANVAVVEVGLGGRLDATNVVQSDVAVVTTIGLDHMEFLGTTLEEITWEKLGIVKEESKLVTGPLPEAASSVVEKVVADRRVKHFAYGRDFHLEAATPAVGGWLCQIEGIESTYDDLFLPLLGRHQTANLAIAVGAAEALRSKPLDVEALRTGVAAVRSPGRMEPFGSKPLVVLDGAHNPQGFEALGRALIESFDYRQWVLLIGTMKDKSVHEMLSHLKGKISAAVATSTGSERSLSPEELGRAVAEVLTVDVQSETDPRKAFEIARKAAGPEGGVIVAGSLYLVGTIRGLLNDGSPPQRNER